MKLTVYGDINPYYAQTLCMVFFPGAKFSRSEKPDGREAVISMTVYADRITSFTRMTDGARSACGSEDYVFAPGEVCTPRAKKLSVGRAVFAAGKALFGYIPPWGILTGVRPAKIAAEYLNKGNGILRTRRILCDEYFLNPQKAALATGVANTEMRLVKKMQRDDLCSIYISIPFCPSRCAYCSFVSYTSASLLSLIDRYLEKLYEDIDSMFETVRLLGKRVASVYIGGGTPTVLDPHQLETLLSRIRRHTGPDEWLECTLEAGRPDTITAEKLAVARDCGVDRISVNPQTLSDDILRAIGRRHTVQDFFRAYEIAQKSGIPHINVDLIAGLPGDNFRIFSQTVDKILELSPSNITVHTFCVKKSSDLLRTNSNIYSLPGGDAAKCVTYAQLKTKFAGYRPYYMYRQKNTVGNLENVGYSKEGAEGLYNIFMMEELHSIFAIGAGAVTKLVPYRQPGEACDRIVRIFTPKYPYEYLRDADLIRNGDPSVGKLSIRDKILQYFQDLKSF